MSDNSRGALLDVKELSVLTGMSIETIYRKRSLGEAQPRALKIGNALRWRHAAVDKWLEAQLERPTEGQPRTLQHTT